MKVFICADTLGGHMELLISQLTAAGIPVEWGDRGGNFSWHKRLLWYKDKLTETEGKVILTDGWDVLFQGTHEELDNIITDRIIISADRGCWPDKEVATSYPTSSTPWRYVNAGGIAGESRDILELLTYGLELGEKIPELLQDDQRFWTYLFLSQPERFQLDSNCIMFSTLYGAEDGDFDVDTTRGGLLNLKTHTHSQFIHANGSGNFSDEHIKLYGM